MGLSCSLSVALVLMTQTNHTWLDTYIYSRLCLLVALPPPWNFLPFQGGAGSYQLVEMNIGLYINFKCFILFFSTSCLPRAHDCFLPYLVCPPHLHAVPSIFGSKLCRHRICPSPPPSSPSNLCRKKFPIKCEVLTVLLPTYSKMFPAHISGAVCNVATPTGAVLSVQAFN